MNTALTPDLEPWNTELRLPRVTDDADLFDIQMVLGGITLVLSRLHPVHAATKFTATRSLAMRLSRAIDYADLAKGLISSEHLQLALAECDKSLDPGTLMMFRKLMAQTAKNEATSAQQDSHGDFTYSDFMAEDKLMNSFPSHTKGMVSVML
jgi:hypothetical protein